MRLTDSGVTRKINKRWRDEVQLASSPTQGYLENLINAVVHGLLRERSWDVNNACSWIQRFMEVVSRSYLWWFADCSTLSVLRLVYDIHRG
jgi:hypothetical protein